MYYLKKIRVLLPNMTYHYILPKRYMLECSRLTFPADSSLCTPADIFIFTLYWIMCCTEQPYWLLAILCGLCCCDDLLNKVWTVGWCSTHLHCVKWVKHFLYSQRLEVIVRVHCSYFMCYIAIQSPGITGSIYSLYIKSIALCFANSHDV